MGELPVRLWQETEGPLTGTAEEGLMKGLPTMVCVEGVQANRQCGVLTFLRVVAFPAVQHPLRVPDGEARGGRQGLCCVDRVT